MWKIQILSVYVSLNPFRISGLTVLALKAWKPPNKFGGRFHEQISALERAGAPRFNDWENYAGEWSRKCFANESPSPYVFMVREVLPMDLEGHPGVQYVF